MTKQQNLISELNSLLLNLKGNTKRKEVKEMVNYLYEKYEETAYFGTRDNYYTWFSGSCLTVHFNSKGYLKEFYIH